MKTYPEIIPFDEQTLVIAKDQPQYRPLPAHISVNGTVTCCWKMPFLCRLKILFTGKVWHQILTFRNPLQPQLLLTSKPELEESI